MNKISPSPIVQKGGRREARREVREKESAGGERGAGGRRQGREKESAGGGRKAEMGGEGRGEREGGGRRGKD